MINFDTTEVEVGDLNDGDYVITGTGAVVCIDKNNNWYVADSNIVNLFYADGSLPARHNYKKIIGPKEALDLLKLGK